LLHQVFIGIPPELLISSLRSDELRGWWEAFSRSGLRDTLPEKQYPEKIISASLGGHRFVAKLDLLACSPGGRWVIVDWKTSTHRRPSKFLKNHIQSRLYPFLLVLAGSSLNNGQPLLPDQVEMIYWFANFPDHDRRNSLFARKVSERSGRFYKTGSRNFRHSAGKFC